MKNESNQSERERERRGDLDRAKRRALFCGGLREKERARDVKVGGEAERFCDNYGKVQEVNCIVVVVGK